MRIQIVEKREHQIGKYKVILLYTYGDKIVGALVETPRQSRPVYIAVNEDAKLRLPKEVIKFLNKMGFKVQHLKKRS